MAFLEWAVARVQVLQYGDHPEVEPGQVAMRVIFDGPASPGPLVYWLGHHRGKVLSHLIRRRSPPRSVILQERQ